MNPIHPGNVVDFIDDLSFITYQGTGLILIYGGGPSCPVMSCC